MTPDSGNNSQSMYQGLDFETTGHESDTNNQSSARHSGEYTTINNAEDEGNTVQPEDDSNTYLTPVISPPSSCPGEGEHTNNPTSHDNQHYISIYNS